MNTNRDRLDEVIDGVAARMTSVEEDAALAARIASTLPDRRLGWTWILAGWAPRLAVLAMAAVAITVVLRTFDDRSTNVLRTEVAKGTSPIVELPSNHRRTPIEPSSVEPSSVEPSSGEPPSNLRRTAGYTDHPDHEFSLPAIAAVAALGVDPLAPVNLAEDAPLTIESLEIADLPLTTDFSPRR